MFYIIGGIIVLLILARLGAKGVGFFLFLVALFVLWRLGVLSFIFNMVARGFGWIFVRVVIMYERLFGDEAATAMSVIAAKAIWT
ncbi:hypothetical protein ACFSL6_13435 [Paenibacillus thailandensis]|uniref:Uncharacterized protein n=1 Tax=Paenibacillus thailandensis TaxID=393250 RepID=A0ABW5QYE7_9BACL